MACNSLSRCCRLPHFAFPASQQLSGPCQCRRYFHKAVRAFAGGMQQPSGVAQPPTLARRGSPLVGDSRRSIIVLVSFRCVGNVWIYEIEISGGIHMNPQQQRWACPIPCSPLLQQQHPTGHATRSPPTTLPSAPCTAASHSPLTTIRPPSHGHSLGLRPPGRWRRRPLRQPSHRRRLRR